MTREDVEFSADGVTLRGWFFPAQPVGSPRPVVVMAHGMTAVKEMHLQDFAEVFAAAGLNVLVYDHRNFGASDGSPRQDLDPITQVRDFRHAITYATGREDVDAERVGVWGSSFSGGHALSVAALDRRVKAVSAQVPFISGHEAVRNGLRGDVLAGLRQQLDEERRRLFCDQNASPVTLPAVTENPAELAIMPTADSFEYFTQTAAEHAPSWRNEITLISVDRIAGYEPADGIHRISPTPLLMVIGVDDIVAPADHAFEAFERAREPKQLVVVPGGHFDIYTDPSVFSIAVAAQRDHFVKYLT